MTAPCPLHDDINPSFRIKLDDGRWRCLAGCGSNGDFAVLVHEITGEDVRAVRRRLRAMESPASAASVERLIAKATPGATVVVDTEGFAAAPAPAEDLSYVHRAVPRYIFDRGFTADTLRTWDVGRTEDGRAVVIPVNTAEGKLIGLVRRIVEPAPGEPKYLNSHFEKSDVLFGEDHLPFECRDVALVEGPLDAMWLAQNGIPAVATLGGPPSAWQAAQLAKRYWSVTLAFDNDRAGRQSAQRAAALLSRLTLWTVTLPPGCKDVQEVQDPDVLRSVFEARQPYLSFRAALNT